MQATRIFRHSRRDAGLIAASALHGLALLLWPSALTIGIGLWWCANTVSHNFIHLPFFRSRAANTLFSLYLSLLMGLPQSLWRQRHLAHHGNVKWRLRPDRLLLIETVCVALWWTLLATISPRFFLVACLPGWLLGLGLCQLQGHYEHVRGTTSHYGWVYNFLFFNDGYHVEHHRRPARHWSELTRGSLEDAPGNRWPAVLRWLDSFSLAGLERLVLRSRFLQFVLVRVHERAFRRMLRHLPPARSIGVVGGALFPRTALVLQRLAPQARLVIIDYNPEHIDVAHTFLNGSVQYERRFFDGSTAADEFDLVIIPLSFRGDRDIIYQQPPARAVLVHDWLWRRRGHHTSTVSWLLLKRVNLVLR
jgi:hypothetical protein